MVVNSSLRGLSSDLSAIVLLKKISVKGRAQQFLIRLFDKALAWQPDLISCCLKKLFECEVNAI